MHPIPLHDLASCRVATHRCGRRKRRVKSRVGRVKEGTQTYPHNGRAKVCATTSPTPAKPTRARHVPSLRLVALMLGPCGPSTPSLPSLDQCTPLVARSYCLSTWVVLGLRRKRHPLWTSSSGTAPKHDPLGRAPRLAHPRAHRSPPCDLCWLTAAQSSARVQFVLVRSNCRRVRRQAI